MAMPLAHTVDVTICLWQGSHTE